MINNGTYYFAVHTSKYYSFSKKVAANYYKIEVSNSEDLSYKIYNLKTLKINEDFIKDSSKELKNKRFFEDREKKHSKEY